MNIYTESSKGKTRKPQQNIGQIRAYIGDQRLLTLGNFENMYRHTEPIIIIYDGENAPNEKIIFEGTYNQFINKLKQ